MPNLFALCRAGVFSTKLKIRIIVRSVGCRRVFFAFSHFFSAGRCAEIKIMSIFALPKRKFQRHIFFSERCRSGRSGRTRNAVYGQLYRGFESLSLRRGSKTKWSQIKTNPAKSRFCGIFVFFSRTSESHEKAPFGQSRVTKTALEF